MCGREATGTGPGPVPSSSTSTAGPVTGDERISAGDASAAAEAAGSATTDPQEVMEGADDPVFQITTEVLYHGSRQAFLSGAHRWMMFGAIVFGASAATSFWGEKACALLAAAAGGADLAFDFVGRAQAHADIRRRYYALGERRQRGDLTDEQFGIEWMLISPDEPPLFRWAELIAFRNACLALGRVAPNPLPWWHRVFAHVLRG